MNLPEAIMQYLTDNPLKKARDVAAALNVAKRDVNSTLYRLEGTYFGHDAEFRWHVIYVTPPQEGADIAAEVSRNGNRAEILRARRALNRLKRGVPPTWDVEQLAVGMDPLVVRLNSLLRPNVSPRWFAVAGEYGEGKSFFRALACQKALTADYAVATLDVNKDEGALNHPQRHYSVIVTSLRSPKLACGSISGLSELFQNWMERASREEVITSIRSLQAVKPFLPPGQSQGHLSWMASQLNELLSGSLGDPILNGSILQWCRSWLIPFLCGDDLVRKGTYARFSAAYRFQLLLKWLEATGHSGLLLFIDEVDNVIRQIPGKGHPGCFRALAWYCSCLDLRSLRVVFASTPEVVDVLDHTGRASFSHSLLSQQTVLRKEFEVYEKWCREADTLGSETWSHCPRLTRSERAALFDRIARIHSIAWGSDSASIAPLIDSLSRFPQFGTTRRWVRATTQLLDVFEQNRKRSSASVL